MRKIYSLMMMLAMMVATLSFNACSSSDDDGDGIELKQDYDVLQVNGVSYACYGYRCFVTYSSTWDLRKHEGEISLPCGKLSDAQKGEYDYDYMFVIYLSGKSDLKKGSKLEDFSPSFYDYASWDEEDYVGGSGTIIEKKDDKYITIKFDSFTFENHTLNGTVKLDLDED